MSLFKSLLLLVLGIIRFRTPPTPPTHGNEWEQGRKRAERSTARPRLDAASISSFIPVRRNLLPHITAVDAPHVPLVSSSG